VHVAGRVVDETIDLLRAGASGERLLHDARHQARLVQERLARVLEGAPAKDPAGEEQHDEQRGRGGDEGGDGHARAQAQHQDSFSPLRR
jgi:hypothetical protein